MATEFRDLQLAEDALAGAFESAVRHWPSSGVPTEPAAWITTTARRRALDVVRHSAVANRATAELGRIAETASLDGTGMAERIGDERLSLMLTCAHPQLSAQDQLALTLRCVAGIGTSEIARLLIATDHAMAARLKRARKKVSAQRDAFALPDRDQLPERLPHVLQCIYLIFTEGYAPTTGGATRPELMDEGIRLARVLDDVVPQHPPTRALLALMLLQSARRAARTSPAGNQVLLDAQDRRRWRWHEIEEGRTILQTLHEAAVEPYLIQALIALELCAQPPRFDEIDLLFQVLEDLLGSPLVTIHRAAAVAQYAGPQVALDLLTQVAEAMARHPLWHAAWADLSRRLPDPDRLMIANSYRRAIALSRNEFQKQAWIAAIEGL